MTEQVPSKKCFHDRFVDLWHETIESIAKHTRRYGGAADLFREADRDLAELRRENVRWENAHKVVMSERELWKGRAERINGIVLRLNADEGLSSGALAGLQRLAQAAGGAAPESKPAHEREPPHCSTCACGLAIEPPVTPPSAIPFAGVSKGVNYEALANATYPERMYGGDAPPEPAVAIPFTHWSKDPLCPYDGCYCSSCNGARNFVANVSDSTQPPGDGQQ